VLREDGSKAPIKSAMKIKESGFMYEKAVNKLLVEVEGTQPVDT